MKTFYQHIVKQRKPIILFFIVIASLCALLQTFVSVNYDMNNYLPEDSKSTIAMDVMNEEFDDGIPNARVMIHNLSIPESISYKEALSSIEGVTSVTWLDDVIDLTIPLETQDETIIETYYKDETALFTVTIDETQIIQATEEIRTLIGDENSMTGSAVSTALATTSTISEIAKIAGIAVAFTLLVLVLTTQSFLQPFVILFGLLIAVLINAGTNLVFGEISFVTNAAGNILQLAISLDYSVFLLHRFEHCLEENPNPKEAMVDALCKSTSSIFSSGLTTVIGFLALVLMRFQIGPDLGLCLAKGIAISLITVFLFMPGLILSTHKLSCRLKHKPFLPSFEKFGLFVCKIMIPCSIVFGLMILPSFLASNENTYYYGSSHIFGEQTQLGKDTKNIEEIFAESDTYVLLVPGDDFVTQKSLSNDLNALDEVTSIISYVDVVGETIPTEYLDDATRTLLVSDTYSRFVLSVQVPQEGDATFALVEEIRAIADQYYPASYHLAGEGVSTYDLMDTVRADMLKVNLVAIGAVFLMLLLTMKSISLPVLLVLGIETAIWMNLSTSYFNGSTIFYIAYLIISSVQLGATVDYAILFTDRYLEYRQTMGRRRSISHTISAVSISILTSGSVLTVVGFLLGSFSSHGILSQLGILLGKGTIFSMIIVFFVLPGLFFFFDGLIQKTTLQTKFFKKLEVPTYEKNKTRHKCYPITLDDL